MNLRVRILVLGALLLPTLSCSKGGDVARDEGADAAPADRAPRDVGVRDAAAADAAAAPADAAGCAHPLPAGWPATFAVYPLITPRCSSLRTRWCTAEVDMPKDFPRSV